MKNSALFIVMLAMMAAGCKKEKEQYRVNATVYLQEEYADANIAFAPAGRTDIIENAETVSEYFNSNPKLALLSGYQYSEYLPEGDYLIIIQLNSPESMKGTYTYRQVTNKGGSPSGYENIMQFEYNSTQNKYQPWNSKN